MMELNQKTNGDMEAPAGKRLFVRLNNNERVQHLIFAGCFIVLAVTGFMLKIPENLVALLGSYREPVFLIRGILHRIAGSTMILVCVYHVNYLLFKQSGRRWLMDMLPRLKDLKDMVHNLLYYLGINKEPPEFDRFNYKHKMEYGALIAGSTLMSVSGLLLWSESMWNKFILDIAAVSLRRSSLSIGTMDSFHERTGFQKRVYNFPSLNSAPFHWSGLMYNFSPNKSMRSLYLL